MRRFSLPLVALTIVVLLTGLSASPLQAGTIKNVIYCIGDGMGPDQVLAGHYFVGGDLSFESFANRGYASTLNAQGYPTIPDSASNGTALATGTLVNTGVISMATPGDGHDLPTLLEYYKGLGKSTGLVTTSYMTDATPAAFGAHEPTRSNTSQIAADYFTQSRPNVLLGGGANGMTTAAATAAGYTVVTNATDMLAVNTSTTSYLSGQFGSGQMAYEYDTVGTQPHLSQMTSTALGIVNNNANGFFLMVEGGNIDHAAHSNDMPRMVREMKEFSIAVQTAISWAAGRDDTLIIVTADHETGGLAAVTSNGSNTNPSGVWKTGGHSLEDVPVYAWGPGADAISGFMKNTDLFNVAKGAAPSPKPPVLAQSSFLEAADGATSYVPGPGKSELGFTSTSTDHGGGTPVAAVYDSATTTDPSPTRFRIQSKLATVTFNPLDISSRRGVTVSIDLAVRDAFEVDDYFRATLTNGTATIDLARVEGLALNGLTDNVWYTYTATVPDDWTQVQIIVSASNNSSTGAEIMDFDRILVRGAAVPEPATWMLLAAGLICGCGMYLRPRLRGKGDCPLLCRAPEGPFRQMGTVPFSPGEGGQKTLDFVPD
jgi:alkaline phosphatase